MVEKGAAGGGVDDVDVDANLSLTWVSNVLCVRDEMTGVADTRCVHDSFVCMCTIVLCMCMIVLCGDGDSLYVRYYS